MKTPRLVLFTDSTRFPDPEPLLRSSERAEPGSVLVIVRDRELAAHERYELGVNLGVRLHAAGQFLGVADRADLGEILEADALHLGGQAVDAPRVRAAFPERWISRGYHVDDRLSDEELGALNAVFVSPVVESRKGRPALGIDGFLRLKRELTQRAPRLSVFALGGIDAENAADFSSHDVASGVAVMAAGYQDDPGPLLRALGIERAEDT